MIKHIRKAAAGLTVAGGLLAAAALGGSQCLPDAAQAQNYDAPLISAWSVKIKEPYCSVIVSEQGPWGSFDSRCHTNAWYSIQVTEDKETEAFRKGEGLPMGYLERQLSEHIRNPYHNFLGPLSGITEFDLLRAKPGEPITKDYPDGVERNYWISYREYRGIPRKSPAYIELTVSTSFHEAYDGEVGHQEFEHHHRPIWNNLRAALDKQTSEYNKAINVLTPD